MTNVIKGIGWNEPAIATEQGWISKSGELLVSSVNLLTNRVIQGFATEEEITRWVDQKLAEIDLRRKKVVSAKETNTNRLKDVQTKFIEDNKELEEKGKTDIESQILFLQKKLELTKLEAEYTKAFASADDELKKLDEREDKVKSYLQTKSKESDKKKKEPVVVEFTTTVVAEELIDEASQIEVKPQELEEEIKEEAKPKKKSSKETKKK